MKIVQLNIYFNSPIKLYNICVITSVKKNHPIRQRKRQKRNRQLWKTTKRTNICYWTELSSSKKSDSLDEYEFKLQKKTRKIGNNRLSDSCLTCSQSTSKKCTQNDWYREFHFGISRILAQVQFERRINHVVANDHGEFGQNKRIKYSIKWYRINDVQNPNKRTKNILIVPCF